jgi:hypothetical protein
MPQEEWGHHQIPGDKVESTADSNRRRRGRKPKNPLEVLKTFLIALALLALFAAYVHAIMSYDK